MIQQYLSNCESVDSIRHLTSACLKLIEANMEKFTLFNLKLWLNPAPVDRVDKRALSPYSMWSKHDPITL